MSTKSKGINAERELIALFWSKGFAASRVAGSGSSRYPSPDVIAGNRERKFAIECKLTKEKKKYFPEEEINQLKEFSEKFNAEPWVAVKFKEAKEWFFLTLEDLEKTKAGFVVSIGLARMKGLLFDELVK